MASHEGRERMPLATGSCFDNDGNLLALYRDAALVAGWTPPDEGADWLKAHDAEVAAAERERADQIIRFIHDQDWPHEARVALSVAAAQICERPPFDHTTERTTP